MKKLSLRKVVLLSASFLLIFFACKKDGALNPEFAENNTSILLNDSLTISTETEIGDTILADKIATGIVGVYRDSVFGKTISNVQVQPLLPSNALVFYGANDSFECDSIVLSLEYDGAFGDISKTASFEVRRIDELLDASNPYYSNHQTQVLPAILGSKTFVPNLDTNVQVIQPNAIGDLDTLSLSPQLRIQLDKALGSEILSKSGDVEVSDNANFVSFLKGLQISAVDPGTLGFNEQALLYFALTSSNSKLSIYYHSISPNNDTLKRTVDFPINSSSVRFNSFEHDYSNSEVNLALQNGTLDSSFTYTLAMAGVQTKIKFPGIVQALKDQNISINKAELVLPVADGSYAKNGFPESLIVASKTDDGALQFIPDFFEGFSYFGGTYNASTNDYRFTITRYLQGLINGTENENGLILLVSGSAVKGDRAVIYGPANMSNKIKLNLYYSKTN